MPRKLKVFLGHTHKVVYGKDGKEYRRGCSLVTAQTSQKKVAEIADTTIGDVRHYWLNPGPSSKHYELAMKHPEKLILVENRHYGDPVIIQIVDHFDENRKYGREP